MTAPRGGTRDLVGKTLGSYEILSLLGKGGMGAVYLAKHSVIGRKAALKVLHPAFAAQPELVQRFFNEARTAGMVEHPSIVALRPPPGMPGPAGGKGTLPGQGAASPGPNTKPQASEAKEPAPAPEAAAARGDGAAEEPVRSSGKSLQDMLPKPQAGFEVPVTQSTEEAVGPFVPVAGSFRPAGAQEAPAAPAPAVQPVARPSPSRKTAAPRKPAASRPGTDPMPRLRSGDGFVAPKPRVPGMRQGKARRPSAARLSIRTTGGSRRSRRWRWLVPIVGLMVLAGAGYFVWAKGLLPWGSGEGKGDRASAAAADATRTLASTASPKSAEPGVASAAPATGGKTAANSKTAKEHLADGTRLAKRGKHKAAAKAFTRAIKLEPDLAEAHRALGLGEENLGDAKAAKAAYERYLELSPDAPDAADIRKRIESL